ncbi:hypothetical protein ACLI07_23815 (plasmid) [Providencia huaxiensis]|uniref:Uncharacterized protein n=2 Tax=Providencia TaxID=586 RepID=A0AA42JUL1_9GAMM|nr:MULTISPECIES: hypothetical protein [Providencia]ELR5094362.1 hypothetical protein [Providencia rettgeri]ELR5243211.1 hypothetical protein [Providencia rettgeri]ELR5280511.1 hypothetical protein [Providencia rettgeri]MBJ9973100.1 hypothetical protein [Providencia rettgeri]MDG4696123.1 hypothetical protein [Providencia sp. CRE-3FA-0001]
MNLTTGYKNRSMSRRRFYDNREGGANSFVTREGLAEGLFEQKTSTLRDGEYNG